jgi:hypothetical protein
MMPAMRTWWGLIALLGLSACIDFSKARETCESSGPCRPADGGSDGDAGADGGSGADGGALDAGTLDAGTLDAGTPGPSCSRDGGYCWEWPVTTANTILSVWTNGTDIWAVAEKGVVLHFDGAAWNVRLDVNGWPTHSDQPVTAVTGQGGDVLMVGEQGYLGHVWPDGGLTERRTPGAEGIVSVSPAEGWWWLTGGQRTVWRTQLSAAPEVVAEVFGSSNEAAIKIAAVSATEAWAIGSFDQLMHLTIGAAPIFSTVPFPVVDGGQPHLESLSLGADGDLWWTGTLDNSQRSGEIWVLSGDGDAGGPSRAEGDRASDLTTTRDGRRYLVLDTTARACSGPEACVPTEIDHLSNGFLAVSAPADGGPVVAAGRAGALSREGPDGWAPLLPSALELPVLLTLPDGGLLAAGALGTLLERQGDHWVQRARQAPQEKYQEELLGGWVTPQGELVFGDSSAPTLRRYSLENDGWADEQLLDLDGGPLQTNLAFFGGAGAWAVGGAVTGSGNFGWVFHQQPSGAWLRLSTPDTGALWRVQLGSDDAGIAVGTGLIAKLQGDTVQPIAPPAEVGPADQDWRDVAVESSSHFWVVGAGADIWEYQQGTWQKVNMSLSHLPSGATLAGQWGRSLARAANGDLWFGLGNGWVLRVESTGQATWYDTGTNDCIAAIAPRPGRVYVTTGCIHGSLTSGGIISLPSPY